MSMTEPKEGVNQVKILSYIAELDKERFRQSDIVEISSLTKGAVSNNFKKLVDEGLLNQDNFTYSLNKAQLVEYYRIHLEGHLRRRPLKNDFKYYNDMRTETKIKLNEMMEGVLGKLILDVLISVLSKANDDGHINTIHDLFNKTDFILCKIAESVHFSEKETGLKEDLIMLAVTMDRTPEYVSMLEKYDVDLKNTVTFDMLEDFRKVNKNV